VGPGCGSGCPVGRGVGPGARWAGANEPYLGSEYVQDIVQFAIVMARRVCSGGHQDPFSGHSTAADLEHLDADLFVEVQILRPYPAALDVLRHISEPIQSATDRAVVHVTAIDRIVALAGMSQAVMVVVLVGTLVEAEIVGEQDDLAPHRIGDALEGPEVAVHVEVEVDRVCAQRLEEPGPCHIVYMGYGRYADLELRELTFDDLNQVGDGHGNAVDADAADPVQVLEQFPMGSPVPLHVAHAGSVQKAVELEAGAGTVPIRFYLLIRTSGPAATTVPSDLSPTV